MVLLLILILLLPAAGAALRAHADTPQHRYYFSLLFGPESTPGPDGWITILDEGFETPPGPLWSFFDDSQTPEGRYVWAPRDCRPHSGNASAWAVGGGSSGKDLPCGSDYPDGVTSWMVYGPFSLADAKAAELRFQLWLNQTPGDDQVYWGASPDNANYTVSYLTANPGGWTPISFNLGDDLTGVNLLGQSRVWIAFIFASDAAGHFPEGAYVDDVLIRKCRDLTCPGIPTASGASAGAQRPLIKMARPQ